MMYDEYPSLEALYHAKGIFETLQIVGPTIVLLGICQVIEASNLGQNCW